MFDIAKFPYWKGLHRSQRNWRIATTNQDLYYVLLLVLHALIFLAVKNSGREFQGIANFDANSELNQETKKVIISSIKCGVPDAKPVNNNTNSSLYHLDGSRRPKRNLSYRILQYPSHLVKFGGREGVDIEVRRAFAVWENVTDLTFTRKESGAVDIEISFWSRWHGSCSPFDGPMGILGHSAYPRGGSFVHFDDDENWTNGSYFGINFFQVAVHEFGHSLGIAHSDFQDSVMYPYFEGYNPQFQLHPGDVQAIQFLYGNQTWVRKFLQYLCGNNPPTEITIFTAILSVIYIIIIIIDALPIKKAQLSTSYSRLQQDPEPETFLTSENEVV